MSTTTLSFVKATTRPSVMVPSSRFLKVSSYNAANASRSNCGSFDFETVLMGTILLFRRLSGADDQRRRALTQRCERRQVHDVEADSPRLMRQSAPSQVDSLPDKTAWRLRCRLAGIPAVRRKTPTPALIAAASHREATPQRSL